MISAGAKSVLDIPRTLEFLETQGVCVVGYGVTEFPAFFTRRSGCDAPCVVNTPAEAARVIKATVQLNLGGCVFGVPISKEHEAVGGTVQAAIVKALRELTKQKIIGRHVTPFLLKRVREL